jgi:predicted PurR-regulated permease PerM
MHPQNQNSKGFALIALLIAVALVILFSWYVYSRTMQATQESLNEEAPEMNVPAPTVQNYNQTFNNVKQNINDSVQKEQQNINNAQNLEK